MYPMLMKKQIKAPVKKSAKQLRESMEFKMARAKKPLTQQMSVDEYHQKGKC